MKRAFLSLGFAIVLAYVATALIGRRAVERDIRSIQRDEILEFMEHWAPDASAAELAEIDETTSKAWLEVNHVTAIAPFVLHTSYNIGLPGWDTTQKRYVIWYGLGARSISPTSRKGITPRPEVTKSQPVSGRG